MFKDSVTGNEFAIRAADLAVIRATYKGGSYLPIPVYEILGGFGNYSTWLDMYNPKLGPVDPSNFAVPSGPCIKSNYSLLRQVLNPLDIPSMAQNIMKSARKLASDPLLSMSPALPVERFPKYEKRQAIPLLAQKFTADFSLVVNTTYEMPYTSYTLSGRVAFDFSKSGFRATLSNINGPVPFQLQTSFIISPNRDGIELLQVSPSGNCFSWFYLQWFWTFLVPPFSIPSDAAYMGQTTISGFQCSIWNYYFQGRSLTLYVRSDGVPMKGINFEDPTWTNSGSTFVLSNIKLSVDPSEYARPKVCTETMTWNPSWQSHLPWYWCEPYC